MADPYFIGWLSLHPYTGGASPYPEGKFPGLVLSQDFGFVDSHGVRWDAFVGTVVNGASIPNVFKPIIGGSFDSLYLKAAVLHDVWGRSQARSKVATDNMFYEAMRTNGVNMLKAYMMWSAVWLFGPKW